MRLFHYNSPVIQGANMVGNTFLLNLCYVACCLPIFTIGAATTALYAVYLVENDDSWVVLRFFRAFISNFKQGTLLFLLSLAAGFLLLLNYYCLSTYDIAGSSAIYVCLYAVTFFYISVSVFSFALLSRYSNTLWQTLKNAAVLTVGMFPAALMIAAVTALPVLLLLVDVDIFLWSVLIWILAGFVVSAKFNAFLMRQIFSRIPQGQEQEQTT